MTIRSIDAHLCRRVLAEVRETCGLHGNQIKTLVIPEMTPDEISFYCRILSETGLIDTKTWDDSQGPIYFAYRITLKGHETLEEQNSEFWSILKRVILRTTTKITKIDESDLALIKDLFSTASNSYEKWKYKNA